MFSNRYRAFKILACLAVLGLMAGYAVREMPDRCVYLGDALRSPGQCDGRLVVAGQCRIAAPAPGGFLADVRPSWPPQFVPSSDVDAREGGLADVLGRFSRDQSFEPVAGHVLYERTIKLTVSVAALALTLIYLILAFAGRIR